MRKLTQCAYQIRMWLPDVVAGAGNGRFWGLGAVTCPLGGGYPSWREAEVTGEVTAVTLDPRISSVYQR